MPKNHPHIEKRLNNSSDAQTYCFRKTFKQRGKLVLQGFVHNVEVRDFQIFQMLTIVDVLHVLYICKINVITSCGALCQVAPCVALPLGGINILIYTFMLCQNVNWHRQAVSGHQPKRTKSNVFPKKGSCQTSMSKGEVQN